MKVLPDAPKHPVFLCPDQLFTPDTLSYPGKKNGELIPSRGNKKAPPHFWRSLLKRSKNSGNLKFKLVLFYSLENNISDEHSGKDPCDNRDVLYLFTCTLSDNVRDDTPSDTL